MHTQPPINVSTGGMHMFSIVSASHRLFCRFRHARAHYAPPLAVSWSILFWLQITFVKVITLASLLESRDRFLTAQYLLNYWATFRIQHWVWPSLLWVQGPQGKPSFSACVWSSSLSPASQTCQT